MAAATIGGKTAQLSVAFGKRAPMYDPAWNVKVKSCPYAHIYTYVTTAQLTAVIAFPQPVCAVHSVQRAVSPEG